MAVAAKMYVYPTREGRRELGHGMGDLHNWPFGRKDLLLLLLSRRQENE